MNRRSFLQMLIAAPLVPVAAPVVAAPAPIITLVHDSVVVEIEAILRQQMLYGQVSIVYDPKLCSWSFA